MNSIYSSHNLTVHCTVTSCKCKKNCQSKTENHDLIHNRSTRTIAWRMSQFIIYLFFSGLQFHGLVNSSAHANIHVTQKSEQIPTWAHRGMFPLCSKYESNELSNIFAYLLWLSVCCKLRPIVERALVNQKSKNIHSSKMQLQILPQNGER